MAGSTNLTRTDIAVATATATLAGIPAATTGALTALWGLGFPAVGPAAGSVAAT